MPRAYQWTTLSLWCTITAGPWLSTLWRLRRWRTAPRPPGTTSTPARRHPCTRWSPLSCPFLRRSSTSSTCWAQTQVSFAPAFPLHTVPWPPCMSLRMSLTSSTCWAQTQVSFAPAFPLCTVPHPPCATSTPARCHPCTWWSPLSCPSLKRSSTSSTCWAQTQVSLPPTPTSLNILCPALHACPWGWAWHSTCWAQTQVSPPPPPSSLCILCPALHVCPSGWAWQALHAGPRHRWVPPPPFPAAYCALPSMYVPQDELDKLYMLGPDTGESPPPSLCILCPALHVCPSG